MIISHIHRYLFIEIPHSACTAIGQELIDSYEGKSILAKHATYPEFLRQASEEERTYFTFCSIRNPLDVVATKHAHVRRPRDEQAIAAYRKRNRRIWREVNYVKRHDADFERYFRHFWPLVYVNRCAALPPDIGFVIRYERLHEDFAEALRRMGLTRVRDLPVVNRSEGKSADYRSYYQTAGLRKRAARVFGPFMGEWGYAFPEDWFPVRVPWWSYLVYPVETAVRCLYYRFQNRHVVRMQARAGMTEMRY
ncbi:MAG: hypothetical protein ISS31_10505 [Kiritimatiellae bacterium]|nr:hypothetical protein [Kiritimatiellia bacterium]